MCVCVYVCIYVCVYVCMYWFCSPGEPWLIQCLKSRCVIFAENFPGIPCFLLAVCHSAWFMSSVVLSTV